MSKSVPFSQFRNCVGVSVNDVCNKLARQFLPRHARVSGIHKETLNAWNENGEGRYVVVVYDDCGFRVAALVAEKRERRLIGQPRTGFVPLHVVI